MPRRSAFLVAAVLTLAAAAWLRCRPVEDARTPAPGARPEEPAPPRPTLDAPPVPPARAPRETPIAAFARGHVRDERGRPVAGARVFLRRFELVGGRRNQPPLRLDVAPAAVTGEDGAFALAPRPPDLLSILAVADGYAAAEQTGLDDDDAKNQDLVVVLARGRGLTGVVRDTEGRPIAGARVSLGWSPVEGRTTPVGQVKETDGAGRYAFATLPTSWSLALVTAAGYATPLGFQDASGWGDTRDFTLRRGALIVDVSDTETGRPIAEARGLLVAGSPEERWGLLEPSPWEASVAPVAPPGRILLWMEWIASRWPPTPTDLRLDVFAADHLPTRVALTLTKEDEPPHLAVRLASGPAEPALAGTVAGGTGGAGGTVTVLMPTPLPYAESDDDLRPLQTVPVGPDGSFVVRGLPAGAYRLRAEAPGRAPAFADARAPARDVRLELAPTGALDVRVVMPDGAAVPGTEVSVEPLAARRTLTATTDREGRARFPALPLGPADAAPGHARGGVGALARHPCRVRVTILEGATVHTEVVVPVRREHVLRVTDGADRPVEGVAVRLEGWGYGGDEAEWGRVAALRPTTDAAGRTSADLLPGEYRGTFEPPWGGRTELRVAVPARPGPEQVVRLERGGERLRGRVLEEGTDAPIAARPVFAHRDAEGDPTRIATAMTDDEGRFVLEGLPRARLRLLLALASSGERGAADVTSPWPSVRHDVDLAVPPSELVVRVPRVRGPGAVERPVRLTARVRASTGGGPIEGATVWVEGLRGGAWIAAGEAHTDAAGSAEAALVAADRYRVTVSGPWLPQPPRWRSVQLDRAPQAGRADVDVSLDRE